MWQRRERLKAPPRLALLLPVLALACAAHQEMPGPIVKSIRFHGNHVVSDRALAGAIMTQRTGWWPFATRHGFDPVVWDRDLDRIVRFYEARGYYGAKVTNVHVDTAKPGEVRLDVEVQEGEPTHLSSLEVKGLDGLPAPDREAARKNLPLAPGRVFTEPAWAGAKEDVRTALRDRGYAAVKVEGEARVDRATRVATAKIEATPGPLSSFGEIRIDTHGGTAIQPAWIWDEVRQAIPEGQRFSDEDLQEARKRLVAMGVFGGVKVAAGDPDPATGRVPVLVDTNEAPFHTLRLGGGLRVDQIRNEGRLIAEWTNRNFLGGLRRLTAHAEAGWAVIPSLFAVQNQTGTVQERNGPVGRARLTFEQPRLFGRPPLRWQTSFDLDRTLEQTYDQAAGRLATGINWRPRSSLTLGPSYHLEGEYLNGATPGTAFSAPLTLGCHTTGNSCFVWLSYVEAAITWDRRDDPLEPHNGFYLGLSVQQGGGPLGGTFNYTRVVPEARAFLSFAESAVTLAARARVGELYTSSGNPEDSAVDTRFYAGGAFSMRGFNERRLSPLLLTTVPATPSNPNPAQFTLPIGGNGLVDSSFEVRWRVTTNFVLAAFVDVGQVTSDVITVADLAHLQYSVGLGARYLTPIGPIRVDFGRRLLVGQPVPLFVVNAAGQITQQPYAVNESCFGLGGSGVPTPVPDGLCALHVSIGEAF
ncbi:MAG TPA: BamA/TamA family outer membrane protein [Polyangia bacterium]|jgi:translocation and assembly module TamA|nr:BamA/TamA family outer membrane protein [Polyangia bacterium]